MQWLLIENVTDNDIAKHRDYEDFIFHLGKCTITNIDLSAEGVKNSRKIMETRTMNGQQLWKTKMR